MDGKEEHRRIKEGLPIIVDGRPITFVAKGKDTDPYRHYRIAMSKALIPIHTYTPEEYEAELSPASSSALLSGRGSDEDAARSRQELEKKIFEIFHENSEFSDYPRGLIIHGAIEKLADFIEERERAAPLGRPLIREASSEIGSSYQKGKI